MLVIDDDDDFRSSVKALLDDEGYEVVEAADGSSGLAALTAHDPDLVVLDVMLESPEAGYRLNRAIRYRDEYERHRAVPIIMVSAIQETPDERIGAVGGEVMGPDRYLTKPLDVPKFLRLVERLSSPNQTR